jgi:hypothetical protein
MIYLLNKMYIKIWSIVAMLILLSSNTLKADPLTPTELHATMGIVTNFILSDEITNSVSHNGITYGTVISPYTGRVWLDRNLGALQVCTSFDDEDCYGDYYQWGRGVDGHEDSMSTVLSPPLNLATNVNNVGHGNFISIGDFGFASQDWVDPDNLFLDLRMSNWAKTNGTSICPKGYRVPTAIELLNELLYLESAEISNRLDAFNSFLKLPVAGFRYDRDGSLFFLAEQGSLWTNTRTNHTPDSFTNTIILWNQYEARQFYRTRAIGHTVRCIKD